MMFSDAELALFKSTFADNEELLYLVRNVLLQFSLSKSEKEIIKKTMSKEIVRIIRKRILPVPEKDEPLGQLGDILLTLKADIEKRSPEEMEIYFDAKKLELDYLDQQFRVLEDIEGETEEKIKLAKLNDFNVEKNQKFINFLARSFIISHVDTSLIHIKTMAGTPTETAEYTKKKLQRNSSK